MKRLLIFILCCVLLCTAAFAAEPVITNMKTDCAVQPSGECRITQTLNLSADEPVTELVFPLGASAADASVAGLRASKTRQDDTDVLVLSVPEGFTGNRTFTVQYTLTDLVTEDEPTQTQLLSVPLLTAKWAWPIERYAFTVSMPNEANVSPRFESGYQGDVIEDYMNISSFGSNLSGTLSIPLKDHESLSMQVEVPNGYFSASRKTGSVNGTLTTILVIVCILAAIVYWFLRLRSPKLSSAARLLPPDSAQPGDMPYLLCCKKASFNAMVLHWASLGYLTVEVSEKGHVTLHKRMEMGNERRKLECTLFEALFADGDTCDGASMNYKNTAKAAIDAVPKFWQRRLYDPKGGKLLVLYGLSALAGAIASLAAMSGALPEGGFLLVLAFILGAALTLLGQRVVSSYLISDYLGFSIGGVSLLALLVLGKIGNCFVLMLAVLLLALFVSWQTCHGGKRTELGTQLISQTLGFRRYLSKITEHRAKLQLQNDPQYFYKTLPYAIALGQVKALTARFSEEQLEPCDWYTAEGRTFKTGGEFWQSLRETLAMLDVAIRQ